MALGFVGSASPLGVLTSHFSFSVSCFFKFAPNHTLKETRLRACPSSHPACSRSLSCTLEGEGQTPPPEVFKGSNGVT